MSDRSRKWTRGQLACTISILGVWVVFGVCEWFFFYWGYLPGQHTDATHYAHFGLGCAILFLVMRWFQIMGGGILNYFIFFGILGWVLFAPAIQAVSMHEGWKRNDCKRNLETLGKTLALSPENDSGPIPRVFGFNINGKPTRSWRAEYLERKQIEYSAKGKSYYGNIDYHHYKPWNDPENLAVVSKVVIKEFQCPSIPQLPGRPECRTDYVAVTGEDTMWPVGRRRRRSEIKTDLKNTAMLIEINDSDIPWYEPRDVSLDDFLSGKLSWTETAPHLLHRFTFSDGCSFLTVFEEYDQGRHILMADGSVQYTQGDMTPDQIRRLFSVTEPFDVEKELPRWTEPRPIPFRYAVFYVWVGSLVLMLVYAYVPVMGNRKQPKWKRVAMYPADTKRED